MPFVDLSGLAFILVFLTALGLGKLLPSPSRFSGRLMLPVVVALVFTISMWGGNSIKGISNLDELLGYSMAYALSTMALGYLFGLAVDGKSRHKALATSRGSKLSLIFVLDLAMGWLAGLLIELPSPTTIISGELYVLASVVGFSLGHDLNRNLLVRGLSGLRAVAYAVAGSAVAGLALSALLSVPFRASMAVAMGFGWYTFDGPAVAAYAGPFMGLLAFLSNFLREQLTYLLVPIMGGNPAALISMGGATTMDDTLPLYAAVLGQEYSVPAMVNGLVLTLIVPIVVPLILSV